jgi:16S rRNA pseudouridine516 synthase
MRLDAFISQNSDFSRSLIQKAIKADCVTVDGVIVSNGKLHITGDETIYCNDQHIQALSLRYLMLHKPAGYVCANSDSEHPTVLDLIELPHKQSLQIVGRLDIDTTGLVLLTDDGQWNHRITSPKRDCAKIYRVTTSDPISAETQTYFEEGVQLHGEKAPTRPALLTQLDSNTALLSIHEGKYHQVKRMFAAVGNKVVALHREQIGTIRLDESLAPAQYRALTADEIAEAVV